MTARPRHEVPARRGPAVTWDAAAGSAVLLVAALVALCLPTSDLTLNTVDRTPSGLPATSQVQPPHWSGGRQDP